MSVNCGLALICCGVAVAVLVVDVVRVVLRKGGCAQNERNNYSCCEFFHFELLFIDKINRNIAPVGTMLVLFYDKQGGPRRDDTTTTRFAAAVGTTSYSQSKVVIIGL